MPSLSCRDSGSDCDWYYNGLDSGDVLAEDLRHSIKTHQKDVADLMKGITEKKLRASEMFYPTIGLIKNQEEKSASVTCKGIGLACDQEFSGNAFGDVFLRWLVHMETLHEAELAEKFKKRKADFLIDIIDAVVR
jgi:predicted small metal-binding protein